jgi:hypothetical protein
VLRCGWQIQGESHLGVRPLKKVERNAEGFTHMALPSAVTLGSATSQTGGTLSAIVLIWADIGIVPILFGGKQNEKKKHIISANSFL